MKTIHKIAAMVIQGNKFLMVRKVGKDIWTNLGGKPEGEEKEEEALVREIKEELDCDSKVIKKLGDFRAMAVFDADTELVLSTYLVDLVGEPVISDPELEEFDWLGSDWREKGFKLPDSITAQIIPYCIKSNLLSWEN